MSWSALNLAVLVLLALHASCVTSNTVSCKIKKAHFTVSSARNATGHWLATLRFEQQGSPGGPTGPMVLDIEPTTSICGEVQTDSLVVRIQGLQGTQSQYISVPSIGPPSPTFAPTPPPILSPGYEHLVGFGYYSIHEEKTTWEIARIVCEMEKAHLLVLNSGAEANAVQQLIKRHPKLDNWVHIGFHDKIIEGHYITIFGQTLAEAGYPIWNPGQPDNAGGNEHCGSLCAKSMGLNDIPCATWKASYICEKNI